MTLPVSLTDSFLFTVTAPYLTFSISVEMNPLCMIISIIYKPC